MISERLALLTGRLGRKVLSFATHGGVEIILEVANRGLPTSPRRHLNELALEPLSI
jgi:hypothetical protein